MNFGGPEHLLGLSQVQTHRIWGTLLFMPQFNSFLMTFLHLLLMRWCLQRTKYSAAKSEIWFMLVCVALIFCSGSSHVHLRGQTTSDGDQRLIKLDLRLPVELSWLSSWEWQATTITGLVSQWPGPEPQPKSDMGHRLELFERIIQKFFCPR